MSNCQQRVLHLQPQRANIAAMEAGGKYLGKQEEANEPVLGPQARDRGTEESARSGGVKSDRMNRKIVVKINEIKETLILGRFNCALLY